MKQIDYIAMHLEDWEQVLFYTDKMDIHHNKVFYLELWLKG